MTKFIKTHHGPTTLPQTENLFNVHVFNPETKKSNVWYWGLDEKRKESGCTQKPLDPKVWSDVHYEVPAYEYDKRRWVSLLFVASGLHPEYGRYALARNLSTFPTRNGKYRYEIDFYPGFRDCVAMYTGYNIAGQAVVREVL